MSKSCKIAHNIEKKWRSQDVRLQEDVDFSSLLLSERVLGGLEKAGFKKPSPIQLAAIPMGKFGRDLLVQAKSGTGKTLVFVIVALETLKSRLFRPQVLVIVPTREIATQVCSVIRAVSSKFKKLTCNSFIGGLPLSEDQAKAVMTQIAVGTPGRLKQLIQMKSLPTNSVRLVVLDEADELLAGSCFQDDIEEIFKALPDDKQVLAMSATFNKKIKNVVSRYLCDAQLVQLNKRQLALLGMVHYFEVVENCPMPVIQYKIKLDVLEKILKTVKFSQCLLFVNGIQKVEILYKDVKRLGFSAAYMSSAKEQVDRLKAIDKLKRFKCKVLVSSNVTARGIDAENVDLVINFDLAFSTEIYMHRVGRAGRYGTIGAAISIIDDKEIHNFESIQKEGNFKALLLPDPLPEDLISDIPNSDLVSVENDDHSQERCIDVENNNLKDVYETNDCDNVSDNDCSSEKNAHVENNQLKGIYETNVDTGDNACENISSEPVTQFAATKIDNLTDIAKPCVEYQVKEINKDDIAHSVSKNTVTVHPEEQTDENVESKDAHDHSIKLDKAENNLLNDFDLNELISCQSSDKSCTCDIHKNLSEKDKIKSSSFEKDAELNEEPTSVINMEKNFEAGDRKAEEVCIVDVPKGENFVENRENYSVDLEQENLTNSIDKFNSKIKAFIDAFESNKEMELTSSETVFDEGNQQNVNSTKKFVTIDMIKNLKYQNIEFWYKELKNLQENNDSIAYQNETEDKKESNEDNAELVVEEASAMHSEFEGNSKCKDVFLEKPCFESTPHRNYKTEQEIKEITIAEACKPVVQNTLCCQQCHELSDESDIDYSYSGEEMSDSPSGVSHFSSVSDESDSLSSGDSEDDSDSSSDSSETSSDDDDSESDSSSDHSDTSSSTASSVNDSIYHHNYSRTGRQNPSLISEPMSEHIPREFDPMYHSRFPKGCKCCGHCAVPSQNTTRSPQMIRGKGINRRHNCIRQNTFNGRNYSSWVGRMVENPFLPPCHKVYFNSANARECCFAKHSGTQQYNQQTHSRCCRSKEPRNRCCAIRGGYEKCKHPTSQTNQVHHHSLSCYLPSSHRCHPNIPGYHCETGPLCEMWYRMFYYQWLHIQNVIN